MILYLHSRSENYLGKVFFYAFLNNFSLLIHKLRYFKYVTKISFRQSEWIGKILPRQRRIIQINPDTRNFSKIPHDSRSTLVRKTIILRLFVSWNASFARNASSLASSSVKREDKCVGEHDTPALSRIKIRNAGQTVRRRPRGRRRRRRRVGGLVSSRTHADFITWATDNGKKPCCIIVGPRPEVIFNPDR